MLTLLAFAAVAGALTAVTPCVLPVLPALLSASGTGGRRRPLGVVLGLVTTHFLVIVALASVVEGVGLADGTTRTLAIVVLAGFGIALLWPAVMHKIEETLAPLSRLGPKSAGDGFGSGFAVGGALGFVYAPCAGPILAAVISVGATQGASGDTVAIALMYSLGSAVALLGIALGGRKLLLGRAAGLQRASGLILVATAILMAADLDVRFQTALANDFPSFISNPTGAIERSDAVQGGLEDVRGEAKFATPDTAPPPASAGGVTAAKGEKVPSNLPVLGTAPELTGTGEWFNTKPFTLKSLRGKVVLVDFWTYTCINCIRTFPALRSLDERYRDQGLVILGVHTPEFSFEKDPGNVDDAVRQNKLRYPVVQDNGYDTWEAFGNNSWPTKYLIDAEGKVRYGHVGEGDEAETEAAVRALLAETGAGGVEGEAPAPAEVEAAAPGVESEEIYLGTERADGFVEPPRQGEQDYTAPTELGPKQVAYDGTWKIGSESALAVGDALIRVRIKAQQLFVVMSSKGDKPRKVEVLVDGRPIPDDLAGDDVEGGVATVREQRLYRLVDLGSVQDKQIELRFPDGVRGFTFNFG